MHILFVDESGTPPKPGKTHPRYFVVGGIIIPENLWHRLRDGLFGMKVRRKIRGEFKWRYFAPDNDDAANPMRHLDQATRDDIRAEIYRIIAAERGVKTMAAICSAAAAYKMPSVNDQEGLYELTYKTITERFQYHLQDLSQVAGETIRGMIIADHRGAGDDKRLQAHHQKLLYSSGRNISKYTHLTESLFFQKSHMSIGVQLADMVAGAVWRKFERNDDRWYNMVAPTLRRKADGTLEGYGIIKVPKAGWV
jgi:hypothetical protein